MATRKKAAKRGRGRPPRVKGVFVHGDVVQLKSGGPKMTVRSVQTASADGESWLSVDWFDPSGNPREASYKSHALKRVGARKG